MKLTDTTLASQALLNAVPEAAREGRLLPAPTAGLPKLAGFDMGGAPAADDFELPAKACDMGRPEGCESCQ